MFEGVPKTTAILARGIYQQRRHHGRDIDCLQ